MNCICHTNEMINILCGMTKACRSLGYQRVYLPLCKCQIHHFISKGTLFYLSAYISAHYPYIIHTPAYKSFITSTLQHQNSHISFTFKVYDTIQPITQQQSDADTMSVQCWASVVDGGPTLNRHSVQFWAHFVS